MIATSRMPRRPIAASCDGNILVGSEVLVLRRIGERLDHEAHLHAVLEHAVLDRARAADEGEDARPLGKIDESLEERRLEALRGGARDRMAEQSSGAADPHVLHRAVAMARRAHRYLRKYDGRAGIASAADECGRLARIGGEEDARWMQQVHVVVR